MDSITPAPGRTAARVVAIATHVPERVLDNAELAAIYPEWTAQKIEDKLGIRERRIAAPDETASDLAFHAAEKLFGGTGIDRAEIDFLIFCTQAPDYILPTSACLLQTRLGLRTATGAFDINLGCSGYVYGLAVAAGLIAAGAARSVLLLTADTYSKFIHPGDRGIRTLFGDGAAATLIRAAAADEDGASIGPFVFGTDGSGARALMVETGGARKPRSAETAVATTDATGNVRAPDNLRMNGAGVMSFSLRAVPPCIDELLAKSGTARDAVDFYVLHQANKFMLDALAKSLKLPPEKLPRRFAMIGNTVSSSIPFVLEELMSEGRLDPGTSVMVVGFGVGLSWAAGLVDF